MSEVIEKLTIGQTERLLAALCPSYEEIGDRTYVCVINELKVLVINDGSSLCFKAMFPGKHSMSKANEWNEMRRYTRSYVKSDGGIVLTADYSFDGGMTLQSIVNFFDLYRVSLELFCQEVL